MTENESRLQQALKEHRWTERLLEGAVSHLADLQRMHERNKPFARNAHYQRTIAAVERQLPRQAESVADLRIRLQGWAKVVGELRGAVSRERMDAQLAAQREART